MSMSAEGVIVVVSHVALTGNNYRSISRRHTKVWAREMYGGLP